MRPLEGDAFDFVGTNNFLGAQLSAEHLIKLGHKHIAFIGGKECSKGRSQRLGGYMSKLMEHGLSFNQSYVRTTSASRVDGALVTKTLLDEHPEITAIICYQDIVAFGVMKEIKEKGLEVGRDIAVVGFDDVSESSVTSPTLTTVSVSSRDIGRAAGEVILARMNGDNGSFKSSIFSPKLVVRESCGETPSDLV